jgi:4-hydroxybenzoate polyprenyltransferase
MLYLKRENIAAYKQLMRTDKPVGWQLLLWPTLWALWIANQGIPSWHLLIVFSLGVFVMRSAGCVINDFADRNFDGHVERTQHRPLASGKVGKIEALQLFALLCIIAFALVITLNLNTVLLSLAALALAAIYPFMKRHTHFPQVVLGAAFGWSIPMAFMASINSLPAMAWWLFLANLLWTVAYDTYYAMVDRDDDVKIGIKSTAVLFGRYDLAIIALLQIAVLSIFAGIGTYLQFNWLYWIFVGVAGALFCHQLLSTLERDKQACFASFIANNRVGAVLFIAIASQYI